MEEQLMENVVDTAREAEALKILRMLDKAIKDGRSIQEFRAELDQYVDGLIAK